MQTGFQQAKKILDLQRSCLKDNIIEALAQIFHELAPPWGQQKK